MKKLIKNILNEYSEDNKDLYYTIVHTDFTSLVDGSVDNMRFGL